MTRVMVTGGNGRLAEALRPYWPHGQFLSSEECDVTNPRAVQQHAQRIAPTLIIHCAAVTSPNADASAYRAVNVVGTANVCGVAARLNVRLVYLSTDYVYPGIRGPYPEHSPVYPINQYAASKLAGEIVALTHANTLAIRGSWYSTLEYEQAATDVYTSAVPVTVAAGWIARLASSTATGVMNVGGTRKSRYELMLDFNPRVAPVSRNDWRAMGLAYPLPADTSLDTTRLRRTLTTC